MAVEPIVTVIFAGSLMIVGAVCANTDVEAARNARIAKALRPLDFANDKTVAFRRSARTFQADGRWVVLSKPGDLRKPTGGLLYP